MSIFKFILTYDFKRPETQVVCDLIYVHNQYRIPPHRAVFGIPRELDQRPDIEDDPNSYIPMRIESSYDFRMHNVVSGFLYRRIPLAAIACNPEHEIVPPPLPFRTYDIIDQINEQLQINLSKEDLIDREYTNLDEDFKIVARPTSKVWLGWRNLNVKGGGRKDLLFPKYVLNTFTHPDSIELDDRKQFNDLLNQLNKTEHREIIDFDFGDVESGNYNNGRNSRIKIKAHKEGFTDQWVYYNRLHPKTITEKFSNTEFPSVNPYNTVFTVYQILNSINAVYGINLTTDDVINEAFLPGENSYTIRFKKTSRTWLDGKFTFKVNYLTDIKYVRLVDKDTVRLTETDNVRVYINEQ